VISGGQAISSKSRGRRAKICSGTKGRCPPIEGDLLLPVEVRPRLGTLCESRGKAVTCLLNLEYTDPSDRPPSRDGSSVSSSGPALGGGRHRVSGEWEFMHKGRLQGSETW